MHRTTPNALPPNEEPLALGSSVSPDYLKVMGIPLLENRFFTSMIERTVEPVVVIDENLARHAFGRKSVCQPTYLDFGYARRARGDRRYRWPCTPLGLGSRRSVKCTRSNVLSVCPSSGPAVALLFIAHVNHHSPTRSSPLKIVKELLPSVAKENR